MTTTNAPLKVFITGASGYIGGDALYLISQKHPEWHLSALVRSEEKAAQIQQQYPNVRIVRGDLDSADIIEREVKNADIVYHFADCDHVAAAKAIANGAKQHQDTSGSPLFVIHTSGTGILTIEDQRANTYGIERPKEYNDWDGVEELTHGLPDDAFHRNVDKIILDIGRQGQGGGNAVKTAIVCPCTIYGPGRGPGNTRSLQAYLLAEAVLKRKKGLLVGEGKNIWHQVHVQDLSEVYLALGEEAAAAVLAARSGSSGSGGGGKATWGDQGYYFAENGSFCWGDIQREVARVAHEKGFIPSPDVEVLNAEQVRAVNAHGLYAWGSNSRGHAVRARKLLGWEPSRPSLMELIPDIVDLEAKRLGLL